MQPQWWYLNTRVPTRAHREGPEHSSVFETFEPHSYLYAPKLAAADAIWMCVAWRSWWWSLKTVCAAGQRYERKAVLTHYAMDRYLMDYLYSALISFSFETQKKPTD